MIIDLQEYKDFIEKTRAGKYKSEELDKFERIFGLASESGEVLDVYKKCLKNSNCESTKRRKLENELGDVFYYLMAILNIEDISLEWIIELNMRKLEKEVK